MRVRRTASRFDMNMNRPTSLFASQASFLGKAAPKPKRVTPRSSAGGCSVPKPPQSLPKSPDAPTPASSAANTPHHHRRQGSSASEKQFEDLVASSIALIQHDRPSNLPAKCTEEALRHKAEHARMVEAARRRVEREAVARHARLQESIRVEERLAKHAREWTQTILPDWHNMALGAPWGGNPKTAPDILPRECTPLLGFLKEAFAPAIGGPEIGFPKTRQTRALVNPGPDAPGPRREVVKSKLRIKRPMWGKRDWGFSPFCENFKKGPRLWEGSPERGRVSEMALFPPKWKLNQFGWDPPLRGLKNLIPEGKAPKGPLNPSLGPGE
ncbi:hypothetical protein ACJJTC_013185 [Scirpophaga incertulas]